MDFWRYIKRAHGDLKAVAGHLERSTYRTVKNFATGVFNRKKRTISITLLTHAFNLYRFRYYINAWGRRMDRSTKIFKFLPFPILLKELDWLHFLSLCLSLKVFLKITKHLK